MSDTATSFKTLASGDKLAGRYEVTKALPVVEGERVRYEVKDTQDNDLPLILTRIGKPTKETEPDKIKRGLERAQRVASWIRTPGATIPRDFICEEGCLYSVAAPPAGLPLPEYIEKEHPPLSKICAWIIQLAGVLEVFHDARQPQFLGRIPAENLRVNPEGQIQLTGFDMGPDFKIEFRSENEETAKAPDARVDARSDVWALGSLLQKCVELSQDDVKKSLKSEADLRSLQTMMLNADPDKRIPNMATVKTRFERISWSKTKLSNTGFSDAPIKVLTVEEKSPVADLLEAYRFWILMGIAGIFLLIAVLQFIFPPAIEN